MEHEMSAVELTSEERTLLGELLDLDFRNLKSEIARTEDFRYKEELKERERILKSVLAKLGIELV